MRAYRRLTASRDQWQRAANYAREVKWPDVAYTIEYYLEQNPEREVSIPFWSKWGARIAEQGITK